MTGPITIGVSTNAGNGADFIEQVRDYHQKN